MKKKFKFISVYLLILAIFSFAFFINQTGKVNAEESTSCETQESTSGGSCVTSDNKSNGQVRIAKAGDITVTYNYGVSEILVNARAVIGKDDQGNNKYGQEVIVFVSGEMIKPKEGTTTIEPVTKKISLAKYFEKGTVVEVKMIYHFFDSDDSPTPAYCNITENNPLVVNGGPCVGFYGDHKKHNPNTYSAHARIKELYKYDTNKLLPQYYDTKIYLLDGNHLVYKIDNSLGDGTNSAVKMYNTKVKTLVTIGFSQSQEDLISETTDILYDTVIPVLLMLLGLAATVTVVVLGYQIVKSADEAQERKDKIRRLRGILIGLVVAFILLAALEPASNFIKGWIE